MMELGHLVVRHRWRLFWIAAVSTLTLALAVGFGIGDPGGWRNPPPHLTTVPAEALAGDGITLSTPNQAPYCETVSAIASHGWVSGRLAGCAISKQAASTAAVAVPDGQGTVAEAVLAQVIGTEGGAIGQSRLAWVVVVHSKYLMVPATGCAPPRPAGPACAARGVGTAAADAVVVVDGVSGEVLATFPVT